MSPEEQALVELAADYPARIAQLEEELRIQTELVASYHRILFHKSQCEYCKSLDRIAPA